MINEIRRRLDAGDVVEIECVDKKRFLGRYDDSRYIRSALLSLCESSRVDCVSPTGGIAFKLSRRRYQHLPSEWVGYFKIKDQ